MLKRNSQRLSILVLVFAAIAAVELNDCRKLPGDDYSAIMACCKDSSITCFEEVMAKCRSLNSPQENMNNDLNLMNACETFCYLNHYEVINRNGSIREEKLVEFLKTHLPARLHGPLDGFVAKCLPKVAFEFSASRIHPPNCHWYYRALVDCIQGELIVNCPESEKVQSDVCDDSRVFVHYCGMYGLRQALYDKEQTLNRTDGSEESGSDYGSDESYGLSSEYDSSYE